MILAILFLLLLVSPTYADDFHLLGDSRYSNYRHVTAISISGLPDSTDAPSSLSYNPNVIIGSNSLEVLAEGIGTLADTDLRRRIPGLMDSVSGPPGTEVDVVYKYFNNAGHSIDISKILVPFSKMNSEEGNWLNVAKSDTGDPEERNITMYFDFRWIAKIGLLKEYQGLGVLEDGEEGSLVLDTLTIVNPIEIKSVEVEELNPGVVKMFVTLENLSKESLVDLFFEHHLYNLEFDMDPLEEVVIEYVLEDFPELGYFKISNFNSQTECAIYGNRTYNWFRGIGLSVIAFREDGGWVPGAIVQPEEDVFCITRTPYTMTSERFEYEKSLDDDNMEEENEVIMDEENGVIEDEENGVIEDEGNEIIADEKIKEVVKEDEREEKEVLEKDEGVEEDEESGQVLGVKGQEKEEIIEIEEENVTNFVLPKTGVVR